MAEYSVFVKKLFDAAGTLKNMAVVSAAGYSIFVERDGGHRIGETTLRLVKEKLFQG